MTDDVAAGKASRQRRTLLLLSVLVVGMFGFGFAMVPLYGLLCQVTGVQSVGLRTSVGAQAAVEPTAVTDLDRLVTVKFDATVNPNLPWDFEPVKRKLRVQPGKIYAVTFVAKNRTSRVVTGQALPSIVPWQATGYFHKLECFCFSQQTLQAGETRDMPLRFSVSPDLPAGINSLTLSYSFLKVDTGGKVSAKADALSGNRLSNSL